VFNTTPYLTTAYRLKAVDDIAQSPQANIDHNGHLSSAKENHPELVANYYSRVIGLTAMMLKKTFINSSFHIAVYATV
jgi:hypothetical protein